ncbi:prolyl oligopeptidase family serine peptidase [Anaeromyxobacter terrae]|uniref:prolyl oligopeptidase family serine peptidase n=1 Tax=Anaeromyxobacter terrae TaxID=2925406 RepID=UPI001F58DED3|nr:prolyl oligopeptidase family serine peptidase [Anaeromyxobacter sp. SG22]
MAHRVTALVVGVLAVLAAACAAPAARAPAAPAAGSAAAAIVPDPPPPTPVRPIAETYHGVTVTDPYRWLEDGASPEVGAWTDAQDARARRFLSSLPERDAIARKVEALLTVKTVRWSSLRARPGRLFALRREPGQQQPALVVLPSVDAPEAAKGVVDPVALDPTGGTTIDFYRPSPDGRVVAVSLSRGGTESGDVHFYETDTGKETFEVLHRVNGGTAGGDLSWTADGTGVYYTRYPRPGERPPEDAEFYLQVFFHRLGTPEAKDRHELGDEFPRTAEVKLVPQETTDRVLAIVQEGDSGRFRHWLRDVDGRWRRITDYPDAIGFAAFGEGDALFVLSRKDAPRGKLLRLALPEARLDRASVIVPEGEAAIDWTFSFGPDPVVTADRIYVTYQLGGPTELRAFALDGKPLPPLGIPEGSSVTGATRYAGSQVLFRRMSFVDPPAWWRVDPSAPAPVATPLATRSPVDLSDAETRREWATSKDGTRVPVTLVLRKGTKLDGSAPCLATGYGGYAFSLVPAFDPTLRVWLDHGGVYAVVHARGGGELGEAWHTGGSGLAKQNTFDDFAAALRLLVDRGYTRPSRLAIEGGSNGGILMGAMITQHPELPAAVISHVGIYDMLRNETTKNGQFNVPEYGSVADPAQFQVLHGYSPYHRVRPGTPYPAVLLLAGLADPRVDVWHSRKLAAALQADSTSGKPVLLRIEHEGGHGIGAALAQQIAQTADVFAFALHELGVTRR